MLGSSNPPSILQKMGLSVGTGSLPTARLHVEPQLVSETSTVVRDILGMGVVN